ncbi:MAG: hypothetical protein ACSLE4_10685, partial [Methyloceanibacter sp.]|uniref:hypothetical protein n=1 Tax=Methyloceanibacter sp. TaxID=1965321 RepID=UPI003EE15936
HLAKAPFLSRTAYERFRAGERKARPGQLAGLISHAEFLKTGGKAAGPLASPAMAPAFAPGGTKIKLPIQAASRPARRKPKRR